MEKRVSDQVVLRRSGMEKRVSDQGADRLRGKEKLAAGRGEPLHSGRGKRVFVLGAALLPDMARPALGDYPEQNMATPFRLQVDIGFAGIGPPACHAAELQGFPALQSVHVCDVPSRGGQRPSLRVCDACPPRVAYRAILCQHRDKWVQDDD